MNQPASETALVLSGGGAYGAFAVGVMKVLFAGRSPATNYEPLAADILTGTSVGAFNAAIMTARQGRSCLDSALRLENIWLEMVAERNGQCGNGVFRLVGDPLDYLDPNCLRSPDRTTENFINDSLVIGRYILDRTANFLASDLPVRQRLVGLVNLGSFVDSSPYENLLHNVIVEQDIFTSKNSLSIIATNWITGAAVHFRNSDFQQGLGIRAIMASTAIPGIFPPVQIGKDVYVDGGIVENTPLKPALDLGATDLHVVYLDPQPRYIPLLGQPTTPDTLLRVYHVMLATKISEDIESARWINAGLRAIAAVSPSGNLSAIQLRDAIRAAGKILNAEVPYKPVTIHRYFPKSTLGGQLGALNFAIDPIQRMIQEGERIALLHDCAESDCVLPDAN